MHLAVENANSALPASMAPYPPRCRPTAGRFQALRGSAGVRGLDRRGRVLASAPGADVVAARPGAHRFYRTRHRSRRVAGTVVWNDLAFAGLLPKPDRP